MVECRDRAMQYLLLMSRRSFWLRLAGHRRREGTGRVSRTNSLETLTGPVQSPYPSSSGQGTWWVSHHWGLGSEVACEHETGGQEGCEDSCC